MTTIDHGQANTRERVLSSDWNRQVELGSRATVEALSASASGAAKETGVFGETAFIVTPLNGTMKSAIAPGLALFYDDTKVYPESQMVWCESREVREVTHPVADALARWDVVEMRPGTLVSSTQPRDQFDPLTGTFTVVNVTKEVKSYPEFQVRSGTPAASPAVPAGEAGWIPLAYVQVLGNAVTVDQTKIVHCRPILGSRQVGREGWTTSVLSGAYARDVKGGGIDFAGGAINNGFLSNTMSGCFGGKYRHNFRLTKTCPVKIGVMNWDGGGLPGADTVVYFYAIPAPYPAGYDASLAGRELWTPLIDNLYGANGGFFDVNLQSGCLIVASTSPPDLKDPAGASTGTGQFQHEFFADAGFTDSVRTTWVYIGAAFYADATTELVLQCVDFPAIGTLRKPGKEFTADLPIAAPALYAMRTQAVGDDNITWPVTAVDIDLQIRASVNNNGNLTIEVADIFGDTADNRGVLDSCFPNNSGGQQRVGTVLPVSLNSSGQVSISYATHTGAAFAALYGKCYRDAVLKLRGG